jgi:hypothetical protein
MMDYLGPMHLRNEDYINWYINDCFIGTIVLDSSPPLIRRDLPQVTNFIT